MLDALSRCAAPCAAILLVAVAVAAPEQTAAGGQSTPVGRIVALDDALALTMARNPVLVAFGYQVEAAEGRFQQATIRPNPELEVSVNDALGSGGFRALKSAEATVSIAWAIERGVRRRQIEIARADVGLAELDARILRLDVAAETARRFIAGLAYQERLGFAAEQIRLAERTIEAVRHRVDAGRSPQAALSRARAGLVRAELLEEGYGHELRSARHRLSAQWGESEPDFEALAGDLRMLPVPEPVEILLGRVERNPDLARFLSRERIAHAELRVARARSRPDWRVYAGVRRFEPSGDVALIGGLAVPFGVRDRHLGRIAEKNAAIRRIAGERQAARVEVESAVHALHQELRHGVEVAAVVRDRLVPELERALADVERTYRLGGATYDQLAQVQAELLNARHDDLESGIGAHETLVELQRLTGEVVLAPGATP